jgi:lipoprotein-releasing system permease protein
LSVFNGFEAELQSRVLGMASDATITGLEGTIEDWPVLREQAIARDDIVAAAPFVEGQALAVAEANETTAGVAVRGIDPTIERSVSNIESMIVAGSLDALGAEGFNIVIGGALAQALGVTLGDEIRLVLAQGFVTPVGMMPRNRSFTVVGVFDAGMYEFDRGLAFIDFDVAATLFATGGRASGLRLSVADIFTAGSTATELARALGGGYYVSDWMRQHGNSFRSIQLTKSIFFVILSLVIAVAAFNIVSTLVMVVRDKRGDVAILRSIGATPRSILAVFAGQGTAIGLLGITFGVALGLGVVALLEPAVQLIESSFGIDLLSEDAYFISDLPTDARPIEVVQIALLSLAIAVAATLYPAWSAARQPPAEALRYE